jgi:chromosome segregation ATPase
MEESKSALEAEKAELEERIRRLEARIKDHKMGLNYTLSALSHQYEKLSDWECSGWPSSWSGFTQMKIEHYEDDKRSFISKIAENSRELDSCKARFKSVEELLCEASNVVEGDR